MAETGINVNVTGTNDLAALTAKLEAFKAKTTLTTNALVQQKMAANSLQGIFRDYGVAVKDSSNQVMYYKDVVQQANVVQNQFGVVADKTTRGIKRFGAVGLQQVGYQVGDFAVQVQGGTSALVALGQQGSQLLGIFGAGGAIAGAILAIGTAILNVRANLKTLSDETKFEKPIEALDKFKSKFDELSKAVERYQKVSKFEVAGFLISDASFEAIEREIVAREKLLKIEQARFELSIHKIRNEITARQELIDQIYEENNLSKETALAGATSDAERQAIQQAYLESLQKSIGANKELFLTQSQQRAELELMEALLDQLKAGTDGQVDSATKLEDAYTEVQAAIREAGGAFDGLDPEGFAADVLSAGKEFEVWTNELRQVKDLIGEANYEALRLAGVDMSPGILKAAAAALSLAQRLNIAFMEAWNIYQLGTKDPNAGKKEKKPVGVGGNVDLGSSGGSKEETQTMEEYVAALEERLLKERELIGLSEEVRAIEEYRIDLVEDLTNKYPEMSAAAIQAAADEITAIKQVNEELEEKQAKMEEVQGVLSKGFEDFFMSIIDGSKTVGEAFADLAQYIISELLRILVIKPLVDSLASSLSNIFGGFSIFGSAQGNVFSPSGVVPFAKGGVVNSPTVFPFANGIGLMGEAGPEAIMPLKRTPSGDLGVIAQGTGGGSPVNVVVNNYGKDEAMVDQQPNGDIVVTVGKAVAQDIANGGATYQAMRKTFGLSQTIKRRG